VNAVPAAKPGDGLKVLVMAGGTGGHVYPALAIAEHLRGEGWRVVWLGTRRGLEARVVPRHHIDLRLVRISGLRGKGWLSWTLAPIKLLAALMQCLAIVRRVGPQVVLGMGGFAAGPGALAAWLAGKPLLIHEQNAIPGLTNRLLARLAAEVMEAFPGSFPAQRRALHTGNPVRQRIVDLPHPVERFTGRGNEPLRLLVLGGSQGARALNEVVPEALATIEPAGSVEVRHQAGREQLDSTRRCYRDAAVQAAELTPFIEDMAAAYGWADLVLCRAGAMTIAELAAAGAASILVPFPFATDDHQTANARYLAEHGAAILLPQSHLSGARLCGLLSELRRARDRLLDMAKAARELAVPDATARVASRCMEAAYG
jgi:UDP-N-acetylglucosamine--N-acetylmuramyl-(pentapeptide) pyrophosphoryl-undecaprenol N-acetylglucosamine transferase